MALKNTKITQGISHVVLLAAIDDLLGIQKQAVDTLVQKNDGDKLTQTDKTIIKRYEEGLQKTLDLIAPAGMEIKNNKIVLNDRHARVLYVYNWPNYLYPNWLAATINFDAEFDIAQYIYPSSNTIIMKMLRKKVTEMRASVRMLEQKGIVRDPVLEAALQDAEELRDLLARGREKLFQFGMYITLYEQDEKRLKKLETDIESLLGGKLVLTKPAVFQMEHAWNSTLPLCLDELEINRNMNTSPLATSFPFSSADLTSDHGILYGINRHNDSLVIFDRFDLPNANATVFATSGAGKSFMVKLEILRSLMFGTEVFVIDPENEYVELSETVGGSHIPISLQSSHRINPFDLPKAVRGEEAETGEILRASAINLHGLFKLMLGTLTPAEDGILDKAILDTYALKKITMDTEDTSGLEPPTMRDLVDVLSTTEGGEHMAQTLKKYTEGSYAGMFDQQTNIELEKQVVVFQIRDLEEQLRPIAMYVILNFLWNRIRADFKKRFLVIDEAWNLMQHEDSARFLYGLIKRARKYYLGITTITQDVEDFVNSPYGKPIITNASLQVLLKQSPSAVDNLQKLFYLTDGEKYLLLNSDVGQGLFFAENKHVAIQIVASPQEEQLITTKPEEVLAKKKVKKAKKDAASHAAATALNSSEKPVQEQIQEEQSAETTAPIEVPKATEAETEAQTPEPKEAPPKPNNESETHTEESEVLQKIKPETPSNKKILNAVESLKSGESLERIVQMEMQENAERDSESAVQEEKIQGEREKEKHADEPPETTPQNPNAMPAPQEIPIEKKVPENPENPENPYLGIQPEKLKG
ncbi:MAG: ATP-binding protein [Candidatus Peribacteraceae bacterium]